jgi:hypothetical protein
MNYRLAYLLVVTIALSVGLRSSVSAASDRHLVPEVEILVGDVPQPRYAHRGRWYVEAQKGREYQIRLRNPYGVRVAVALSVDGLNTIDARETTAAEARKWVISPYETVTIRGWQTSRTEARRFEFTIEARSYGQALGKTANLGVITAVFYKERTPVVERQTTTEYAGRRAAQAPPPSASPEQEASAPVGKSADAGDEYAATGMGRRTGHAVMQVRLDLESTPVHTVNIRYEFRPQLVGLGILSPRPTADPLQRRERARGFEPGFSPEPPHHR